MESGKSAWEAAEEVARAPVAAQPPPAPLEGVPQRVAVQQRAEAGQAEAAADRLRDPP